MIDAKYNPQNGKYEPLMCCACPQFYDDGVRDAQGRKGYCMVLHIDTHHIDWCHEPEEQERHKAAMAVYQDCGKH